jgi:hypothetical protein
VANTPYNKIREALEELEAISHPQWRTRTTPGYSPVNGLKNAR